MLVATLGLLLGCTTAEDREQQALISAATNETETSEATDDLPPLVEEVDDRDPTERARDEAQAREQALEAWQPTTSAPAALDQLATEPGELAWYVDEDPAVNTWENGEALARLDHRLGTDADEVCGWLAEQVRDVQGAGIAEQATQPDVYATHVALRSTPAQGDGLTALLAERCLK